MITKIKRYTKRVKQKIDEFKDFETKKKVFVISIFILVSLFIAKYLYTDTGYSYRIGKYEIFYMPPRYGQGFDKGFNKGYADGSFAGKKFEGAHSRGLDNKFREDKYFKIKKPSDLALQKHTYTAGFYEGYKKGFGQGFYDVAAYILEPYTPEPEPYDQI